MIIMNETPVRSAQRAEVLEMQAAARERARRIREANGYGEYAKRKFTGRLLAAYRQPLAEVEVGAVSTYFVDSIIPVFDERGRRL